MQVKGLCGFYDQNKMNDFMTEAEIIESDAREFVDSFLSSPGTCTSPLLDRPDEPCSLDAQVANNIFSCDSQLFSIILVLRFELVSANEPLWMHTMNIIAEIFFKDLTILQPDVLTVTFFRSSYHRLLMKYVLSSPLIFSSHARESLTIHTTTKGTRYHLLVWVQRTKCN